MNLSARFSYEMFFIYGISFMSILSDSMWCIRSKVSFAVQLEANCIVDYRLIKDDELSASCMSLLTLRFIVPKSVKSFWDIHQQFKYS